MEIQINRDELRNIAEECVEAILSFHTKWGAPPAALGLGPDDYLLWERAMMEVQRLPADVSADAPEGYAQFMGVQILLMPIDGIFPLGNSRQLYPMMQEKLKRNA